MQTVRKYQEINVNTASPMELIVMLYDECIRSLEKAEKAFAIEGPERIENINNALLHAQDIITELAVSLDMEKGGVIAQNLQKLYDFMVNHLSHANIIKIVKPVSDVKAMMLDLREAWKEIAAKEDPRGDNIPTNTVSNIHISG